jgi:hypothetical protein
VNTPLHQTSTRRLEIAVIAFFTLMFLSLLVIYAVDPSIYLQSLKLTPSPVDRFPWPATLFLICLVAFLGVLSVGVLRHWRWTFWLMLIAFSASVLQFPAELLQISGVLPLTSPLWYSLFRLAVAVLELGLAVWMIQVYRHKGIWAMGRKRTAGHF